MDTQSCILTRRSIRKFTDQPVSHETLEKIINPHFKMLYRFFSKDTGKAMADYVTLHDEKVEVDEAHPITIFDPIATWKKKTFDKVEVRPMLVPIFFLV